MMALIRTKLVFALVRAAVACLRGHRHKATRARAEELDYPASLTVAECNLSWASIVLFFYSGDAFVFILGSVWAA